MKQFLKYILNFTFFLSSTTAMAEEAGKIDFYGFLLANTTTSIGSVDSLGRNNLVAFNSAANPALAAHPNTTNNTFQIQQSRLGLKYHSPFDVMALTEVDFVDFNKSTPTVASFPRLRRAVIQWTDEAWTWNIGQDWDLFSPLGPTTYNYIGHYFLSGDLGFMRLQAQALHKGDNNETGFAVGFPSFNNQTQQSTAEYSKLPTLSLRQTFYTNDFTWGGSAIVGHLESNILNKKLTPYALNVFLKYLSQDYELNFESYYGENVENLSLQGLGYSSTFQHLKEAGTYATLRFKISENQRIFGGLGYAEVLNPHKLTPSYDTPIGATKPVLNLLTGVSTGYGISKNATLRLGYEHQIRQKLNFFVETSYLYTEHKLKDADLSTYSPYRHAQVIETGIKLEI